jgi:hypothetical protein
MHRRVIVTGKDNRCTAASSADYSAGEDLLGEEEDFDALLAASSFGSEQALAIRAQTPAAAREHARRVLDGEEKCAPVEGDIDDAVGGLVYGLAHGVVPGRPVSVLDGLDEAEDLVTAWEDLVSARISGRADLKFVIVAACQTSMLWPDHRAHLLQALIDHDAFTELRPDVAWNIVNWTFSLDRPPRVLRQCASLAFDQIDIGALAFTSLPAAWGEAAGHSRRSSPDYREYLMGRFGPHFRGGSAERGEVILPECWGVLESAHPALNSAPVHSALAAPSAGPSITVQTDLSSADPSAAAELQIERRRRHAITVAAVGTPAVIGALLSFGGAAILGGLIAAIASGIAVIGLGVAVIADTALLGGPARSERAFRRRRSGNRPEPPSPVPAPPAHSPRAE